MTTFLMLCQRVREEMGFAGDGPSTVLGQTGQLLEIVNAVKKADLEIQNRWSNWQFLLKSASLSTVANQAVYTTTDAGFPTDLTRWDAENIAFEPASGSGYMLNYLDYRVWEKTRQFSIETAMKPTDIVINPNNSFRLLPPPDAVYSLTMPYFCMPVELAGNTDISAIPSQFQDVIVYAAVKKLALRYEAPMLVQYAVEMMEYWFDKLDVNETQQYVTNQGYAELDSLWAVRAE